MIFKAFRALTSWLDNGAHQTLDISTAAADAEANETLDERDIASLGHAVSMLSQDLDDTLELIRQLKREVAMQAEASEQRLAA